MLGSLLVSISSIFDATLDDVTSMVRDLDKERVPVSLLVAPHIDATWHLAKDTTTRGWLAEQRDDRALLLNGFDQAVQGRRSEFATLGAHEARLRLKGATRQMAALGFDLDMFAPPRWRMSEGTLEVMGGSGLWSRRRRRGSTGWLAESLLRPATCRWVRATVLRSGGAET